MNHSALASIISEDVTFIGVRYLSDNSYDTSSKTYHFKTLLKDLKIGDVLIVQTRNGTFSHVDNAQRQGCTMVEIVETEVAADLNASYNYLWAFQKVDFENLKSLVENEKALIKEVQQLEIKSKRAQLKAKLAEEGIDLSKVNTQLLTKD